MSHNKTTPSPHGRHRKQAERHGDRKSGAEGGRRFLTGPQVCARYAVSDMSLWRWLQDPALGFPEPALRIRGRRYWLEHDLIAWERGHGAADLFSDHRNAQLFFGKTRRTRDEE